jgi:hypothetical protein
MNIEDQVCSFELAKRLKELGVKQESFFYWADGSIVTGNDIDLLLNNGKVRSAGYVNNSWPDDDVINLYSLFTVAELGEMLGSWCVNGKANNGLYWCDFDYMETEHKTLEISEANARAKMVIYLIENGLLKND